MSNNDPQPAATPILVTPKSPVTSTTNIFNLLMSLGTVITVLSDSDLVKADPNLAHIIAGVATVWGVINIIIRFYTKRPIQWGA